MKTKFRLREKEKIFKNIRENGYAILHNIYSKKRINRVKNSLFSMLNYIKFDDKITDLQEKYYQVKDYNPNLKAHFYDMCAFELETRLALHDPIILDLVKGYFGTDVLFSGRPAIHIHDSENERFLEPHQETNMFSKDFLFVWAPLYDAKEDQGGLLIYKNSHKHGYWKHRLNNKIGSTNINLKKLKKFKKKILQVNVGSALLIHSAVVHGSVKTRKKRFARFVMTDRFCPLIKLPYLRNEKASLLIPYMFEGEDKVDYNTIID